MKTHLALLSLLTLLICSCGQGPVETASETPTSPEAANRPVGSAYDSLLAQELGADDYGMKVYVMAFLYRGGLLQDWIPFNGRSCSVPISII